MPYNVIKNSKGKYKVRYKKGGKMHTIPGASESKEKAKKRIAAIEISKHMHESLESNYVGPFMFKRVFTVSGDNGSEYGVSYQLKNATITFYYSYSKNMDEVVFKRGFVNSPEFVITFNDEQDEDFEERLEKIQDQYNISFDEIENATQDGYERIKEYIEKEQEKSEEIKKKYDLGESLSFESYFKTIMESHHGRLVSNCCGARPSPLSDVNESGDVGICSECGEHAEFESEEE